MKKNRLSLIWAVLVLLILSSACERDHYLDGGLHKREIGLSTYDYIASRPDLFSKTKYVIDKNGLKEAVNKEGITMFVPQDRSIEEYIISRKLDHLQFEKLPDVEFDTLGMQLERYLFPKKIERADLTLKEKWYIASSAGMDTTYQDSMRIALSIYGSHNGSSDYGPRLVSLIGIKKVFNKSQNKYEYLRRNARVFSSDLLSTNGVVHVLDPQHVFGF